MKKALYILFLIALAMPIVSHSQSIEKKLIGTWLMDDKRSFSNLSQETIAHFDTIPDSQVAEMKNYYIGRKVTFNSDGSFLQELSDGRRIGGNWSFDPDTNAVTITHPQGGKFQQTVRLTGTKRLLLVPVLSGNVKMFINQWYFTKL